MLSIAKVKSSFSSCQKIKPLLMGFIKKRVVKSCLKMYITCQ